MENHQFNLISNTYPVSDAKEILLSLINDKIKFLNCKVLSLEECYGCDTDHLKKRVSDLKAERAHLKEMLGTFADGNHSVEVDCQVTVKVKQGVAEAVVA